MARKFSLMGALAIVAAFGATPVLAQDIATAAAEAEAAAMTGDGPGAWAAFDRATELFWADAPLTFRTAVLADSIDGPGQYRPVIRDYRAGDIVTAYFEPLGYGWTPAGAQYRIRFAVDFEIRDAGGTVLASATDFAVLEQFSLARSREFAATLALTLPALPPGGYELSLVFRDAATAKSAAASFALTIAP